MSSQQQRRDNTTHERELHVEKDIVPKTTTKFEELAKDTDAAATATTTGKGTTVVAVGVTHTGGGGGGQQRGQKQGEEVNKTQIESIHDKVRGLDIGGGDVGKFEEKSGRSRLVMGMGESREDNKHQIPSHAPHLVAQERYAQSKQHGAGTEPAGKQQKKQQTPSLEEVSHYRQIAQQNSMDALHAAEERYSKAKEEAANAASAAKESAKHGIGAAATKTREAVGATTQYISEKTVPVKETAAEKAQQAKETLSSGTQWASEYASEKAVQAKDTTVSTTKTVAGYVGEKATVAKDVAVETGKAAAGYAGKVAEGVKDQAVVAGWGVAHKTTEIAVEATKMAGGVVGKAKDVVASAAHKAAELAEVPVVMARDTAVDAGEKLADYTARKKMEAEKYKEEKQAQYYQEGEHPASGGGIGQKIQESMETITDTGRRLTEGSEETMTEESGAGVLGAIGETIVEIAQQTTQLVAGPGPQAEVRETDKRKEM